LLAPFFYLSDNKKQTATLRCRHRLEPVNYVAMAHATEPRADFAARGVAAREVCRDLVLVVEMVPQLGPQERFHLAP